MMASSASSSASASSSSPEQRPQAEPLPVKRGEIGYSEPLEPTEPDPASPSPALPRRHPADTEAASPSADSSPATPPTSDAPPASPSSTDVATPPKATKHFRFWKSGKVPSYGGIRLPTFLAFLFQVLAITGTIAGWALAIIAVSKPQTKDSGELNGNTSTIFVHVVFAIGVLGQLLFLERRVFRLRAERYSYIHPGEILPTSRSRALMGTTMAYAPWHRPPLPTYAAALAQSGVGTGDVEDHLIAQPPPPAYGQTRGSTLLLAGFLRESLRAQRPISARSAVSTASATRPMSYVSKDGEWEEIQDAERARRLEETLSRLERPTSRIT